MVHDFSVCWPSHVGTAAATQPVARQIKWKHLCEEPDWNTAKYLCFCCCFHSNFQIRNVAYKRFFLKKIIYTFSLLVTLSLREHTPRNWTSSGTTDHRGSIAKHHLKHKVVPENKVWWGPGSLLRWRKCFKNRRMSSLSIVKSRINVMWAF